MTNINSSAESARENARQNDGKFGQQHHDADTVDLAAARRAVNAQAEGARRADRELHRRQVQYLAALILDVDDEAAFLDLEEVDDDSVGFLARGVFDADGKHIASIEDDAYIPDEGDEDFELGDDVIELLGDLPQWIGETNSVGVYAEYEWSAPYRSGDFGPDQARIDLRAAAASKPVVYTGPQSTDWVTLLDEPVSLDHIRERIEHNGFFEGAVRLSGQQFFNSFGEEGQSRLVAKGIVGDDEAAIDTIAYELGWTIRSVDAINDVFDVSFIVDAADALDD